MSKPPKKIVVCEILHIEAQKDQYFNSLFQIQNDSVSGHTASLDIQGYIF